MIIKYKKIIEKSVHNDTEVSVVATTHNEIQIQVEKPDEDMFFNLHIEDAVKLRYVLTEFIGY